MQIAPESGNTSKVFQYKDVKYADDTQLWCNIEHKMMRFLYLGVKIGPKDPGQLASTSKGSFKTKTKNQVIFIRFVQQEKLRFCLKNGIYL